MKRGRVSMADAIYCIGCDYELRGLGAGSCPECGRAFDPEDASSVRSERQRRKRSRLTRWLVGWAIAVGCTPLIANLLGFVSLAIARVSLGRWPHRGGMDDPKYVDGVRVIGAVAILTLVLSLPAVLAVCALALAIAARREVRRALLIGTLALTLWLIGFALARWDLARVWYWLFD